MHQQNNLKFPNLTILFAVLFLTYLFLRTGVLHEWVMLLGDFGYISALLIGIFFVSTFTVIPATAILFFLSESIGLFSVSLLAGIGAVLGDYIIFRFVKDDLVEELKSIFRLVAGDNVLKFHWIIHTKYFVWLSPVLGALIIASPFPDELGIGLLGMYKLNNKHFLTISFVLNTIGIFLLLSGVEAVV